MSSNHKIYFISGVSGVGKTSVMKELKALLPSDAYDIRDFDERGVPDNAGPEWHNDETIHWLELANENAKLDKSTIVCGVIEPESFSTIYETGLYIPAQLFYLHASEDILRQRLLGRYTTPESREDILRASGRTYDKYIEDMVIDALGLLSAFEKVSAPIINTDTKTPKEVAEEIVQLL